MASRTFSIGLLLVYGAVLLAPFAITVDFLFNRERIAKEHCVQRAVPEAERTCHGQCCLMKKLLAEKNGSSAPAAPPTLPEKIHPEFLALSVRSVNKAHHVALNWLSVTARLPVVFRDPAEPVPWC